MDCTVWNERHRTRLACRRPGAEAYKDIEWGKVPSATTMVSPFLYCLTMSWWVVGSLRTCSFSFFGLGAAAAAAACCCVLPTTSVLKRREVPATVSSFSVSATTTAVSFASILFLLPHQYYSRERYGLLCLPSTFLSFTLRCLGRPLLLLFLAVLFLCFGLRCFGYSC